MLFTFNSNFSHINNTLNSQTKDEFNESLGIDFENSMIYKITNIYLKPSISIYFKKWAFVLDLKTSYNNLILDDRINRVC
jgi:hypothetical protein